MAGYSLAFCSLYLPSPWPLLPPFRPISDICSLSLLTVSPLFCQLSGLPTNQTHAQWLSYGLLRRACWLFRAAYLYPLKQTLVYQYDRHRHSFPFPLSEVIMKLLIFQLRNSSHNKISYLLYIMSSESYLRLKRRMI
ncbi:hypothetical protein SAMN05421863_11632 [Nitrosomonas communis]|uniref:Uncharacterized protein n=1 Tax=Nitrosomonas communis TaxID=44574 RepID=A0A1I4XKX4_9PROT|nr:hypothetical protein SAMN05421863_11632 [Nitrosomonas communis]